MQVFSQDACSLLNRLDQTAGEVKELKDDLEHVKEMVEEKIDEMNQMFQNYATKDECQQEAQNLQFQACLCNPLAASDLSLAPHRHLNSSCRSADGGLLKEGGAAGAVQDGVYEGDCRPIAPMPPANHAVLPLSSRPSPTWHHLARRCFFTCKRASARPCS